MKRPPIIVVMGHVDHGKSTLIDFIRKTKEKEKEAGGITQAIGAYEIKHKKDKITFIDTPGHKAFNNMREYGAVVADLAVLVVASDDGVKPQTKDALSCIQKAEIPFVVAINKIDKDTANLEKTKSDLAKNGILLEGFGGNVSWQAISATTGSGVEELLDLIVLATDLEELKYDPKDPPSGVVITSRVDPHRGVTVGVIIQNGILKLGNYINTPSANGKIKILQNFKGETVSECAPSAPALVLGFTELPRIGELFTASVEIEKSNSKNDAIESSPKETEELNSSKSSVRVILKADEYGSKEALQGVVEKFSKTEEGNIVGITATGVGNITEKDVQTAVSTGSIIIGFNTKTDSAATNLAHSRKIKIINGDVIYKIEEELKKYVEKRAQKNANIIEVLALFGARKGREQVIGGKVLKGEIQNKSEFEIWSEEKQIGNGTIKNLQSGREDADLVSENNEMGALIESTDPIAVGYKLVFVR